MFLQATLVRKAFFTLCASVRFFARVYKTVHLHLTSAGECFTATVALVRRNFNFVTMFAFPMLLQRTFGRERLFADSAIKRLVLVTDFAIKRLGLVVTSMCQSVSVTSVGQCVAFQVVFLPECFLTVVALKGLVFVVSLDVFHQRLVIEERLGAAAALIRPFFVTVLRSLVALQIMFTGK